jgi:hypothetical protein
MGLRVGRSLAAAGRRGPARTSRPAGGVWVSAGGVRMPAELDTAAVSAVCCCFRNRGRVSGRLLSTADVAGLQEGVARPATAGRVQPLPVRPTELGGEPVTQPCPRQGHGWPLQRQGLLGGQPTVREAVRWPCCQQLMPRWRPPAGRRPAPPRCYTARRAAPPPDQPETPAPVAPGRGGRSPAHTPASRPAGTAGYNNPAGLTTSTPGRLVRVVGAEQQAQVAVRHPAGLQQLAVGVWAEVPHGRGSWGGWMGGHQATRSARGTLTLSSVLRNALSWVFDSYGKSRLAQAALADLRAPLHKHWQVAG